MASPPLLSIVIPSYNQVRFLEETLQSVLSQSYPHKEVIVIDGGSSDGSVDVIQRHASSLACWESGKDRGQAYAVNKGWIQAKGDVLGWLNSDDLYEPDALAKVAEAYRIRPDAALLYGDVREIDETGGMLNRKNMAGFGLRSLLLGKNMGQPGVFVSRRAYQSVGGLDETLHYALDFDYFLRIWSAYPQSGAYIPSLLASSRRWQATKTSYQTGCFAEEYRRILEAFFQQPDLPREIRALKRKSFARSVYFRQARLFLLAGDWKKGVWWIAHACTQEDSLYEAARVVYAGILAWRDRDAFARGRKSEEGIETQGG